MASGWLDKAREYKGAFDRVGAAAVARQGVAMLDGQAAIFLSRPRCFSMAQTRTSSWRSLSISCSLNLVSLVSRRFIFPARLDSTLSIFASSLSIRFQPRDVFGECRKLIVGRGRGSGNHSRERVECGFLRDHMRGVYHTRRAAHGQISPL
jgi:hypothetical protein